MIGDELNCVASHGHSSIINHHLSIIIPSFFNWLRVMQDSDDARNNPMMQAAVRGAVLPAWPPVNVHEGPCAQRRSRTG
jgi:hypothetical protein